MKTVTRKRINKILAQTNWQAYWESVQAGVEIDVRAYDEARRKSLAHAQEKVLRTV